MDDSGRVVVITGGSKGIGRAVALRFAQEKSRMAAMAELKENTTSKTAAQIAMVLSFLISPTSFSLHNSRFENKSNTSSFFVPLNHPLSIKAQL